jgi:hypothetical protein
VVLTSRSSGRQNSGSLLVVHGNGNLAFEWNGLSVGNVCVSLETIHMPHPNPPAHSAPPIWRPHVVLSPGPRR